MAIIGNWNGHTFEVSPNLIRGFTELSIRGSCETTTKNSNKQQYEERKYGDAYEITLTVHLNAILGVTSVLEEAMAFVQEATEGASGYFYVGSSKLVPSMLILTDAEVVEVNTMPGRGDVWVSCDVRLTLKQANQGGTASASSSSSSGSGSQKVSVKATGTTTINKDNIRKVGKVVLRDIMAKAKTASSQQQNRGLTYVQSLSTKDTKQTADSSQKTNPTTGRAATGGGRLKESNVVLMDR